MEDFCHAVWISQIHVDFSGGAAFVNQLAEPNFFKMSVGVNGVVDNRLFFLLFH